MKLKIGIIGTNFISRNFCDAASDVPGICVHAVYSRARETGERFAREHSIRNVYTDFYDFLSSDIDAVYVASPNFMHCRQTIDALKCGKHVLCEKIMGLNEREVSSMIECSLNCGCVLLEAMRPDFDPAYSLIGQNMSSLGRLRRVSFEYCQYSSRYDDFRKGIVQNAFNPLLGNAALLDIGVYCVHSIVRLFGMPETIKAFSTKLSNGFDGSGIVLMQYGEMTAEAIYSKISASVNPSVIQGEDGSLLIDYISHPEKIELRQRSGSRDPVTGQSDCFLSYTPARNNMVFEIKEFMTLIENDTADHRYLRYSLDTVRVIDEARRQCGIVFPQDSYLK